jgi:gamma-glutamylputrescine oxidase
MPSTAVPERTPSYYTASLRRETDYPTLQGEVRVDVAIIGGGFTGVATALELTERGLQVALVEARKIGWGASGRNGGQVTGSLSGAQAMQRQLRHRAGADAEDFIWRLRWRGHEIIEARVARYAIDCDLRHGHLHAALTSAHMLELRGSLQEAQRRGMDADVTLLDRAAVRQHLATERYLGALKNRRNFHLHPLKLCIGEAQAAAAQGALLFEHSPVVDIVHGAQPAIVTPTGRVTARHVLLAGDVYHCLERRRLSGMVFPAMGGIIATRPLGELGTQINPHALAVYDCRFVLDYYRPTADGRLLFGGGANYSGRESRDVAAELRPAVELTFPQLRGVEIDFKWTCAMAEALTGQLARFDTFAAFRHIRVPYGDVLGNPLLAAGMWYYSLRERLR